MVLEMLQFYGGHAVTLKSQVAKYPGRYDVYRPLAMTNPERAVRHMRRLAGTSYGYKAVARASFLHMPFVRLFVKASVNDALSSKRPPYCSQAVASAVRAGGVDLVPNLSDRLTEPGDLARSSHLEFMGTLVP